MSLSKPSADPENSIHVAVVEDDAACRQALIEAIEVAPDMALGWAVGTREEALAQLNNSGELDVLLVDLGLPDGSGLDVIAECRTRCPRAVAMVSTIFGDEVHVLRAIEAGAMGYLLKDLAPPAVLDELRSLHAGGSPINPMVARKLLLRQSPIPYAEPLSVPTSETALSQREAEVLRLVARGHTLDEVGRALGVTRHTVRSFVRRIYAKLQVGTRAQAVHAAIRQGLLEDDRPGR
ncbi:response regulator transcription factor [Diaphorobacter sp. HDW4A]|uniref:response regulator transcription factor n=1 Tax=Diaphorobacter sp. HDW4A TaxID=2714924 RepID=UPI00140988B5|nr:response regulator transcription factor [Diaphorobacter sp. HDW4A]QIL82224.1 response regulator transcription factor [Diaphorobacter sp. HDW4A]